MSHVLAAARSVAEHAQGDLTIINKSTVPAGARDRIK
jgi:UDP-glucose 6-dehydrogenase